MSFVFVNAGRTDLGFARQATVRAHAQYSALPAQELILRRTGQSWRDDIILFIFFFFFYFKRSEREEVQKNSADSIC